MKNKNNNRDKKELLSKDLKIFLNNENNINKLVEYCNSKIELYTGCKSINGKTGNDYFSEAVLLILEGKRKFDESKCSLEKFIYLTCLSLIRNDAKKKSRREKYFIEEQFDFQAYEAFLLNTEIEDSVRDNVSDISNTINDNTIDNSFIGEKEENIYEKFFKILNYCKKIFLKKNDKLCYVILDDIENYKYSPDIFESNKRLAEIYHVDVKDIVNAKKRIKRAVKRYRKNNDD